MKIHLQVEDISDAALYTLGDFQTAGTLIGVFSSLLLGIIMKLNPTTITQGKCGDREEARRPECYWLPFTGHVTLDISIPACEWQGCFKD